MPTASDVARLLAEYTHTGRGLKEERLRLAKAKERLAAVEQAQRLAQDVAQKAQTEAHDRLAGLVTKCLQSVFPDKYTFKIVFEKKRGKTEARLVFLKGRHEVDPTEGAGGGVLDVASFALRVSCLLISRPRLRRFLVLDEPFRGLHEGVVPRVQEMIERLAEELGIQIILVTQIPGLRPGKVIEIGGKR